MVTIRSIDLARAQRANRYGDLALLWLAALCASWNGVLNVPLAAGLGAVATLLWLGASRVLRQYGTDSGRSPLGDLALTAVMLAAVALPILAAGAMSPLVGGHGLRFAAFLIPAALALRFGTVSWGLWDSRYIDAILIVGIGPLGRLTGTEIASSRARHRVLGYLRFDDEAPNERLHAPVLEVVSGLESTLKEHVVDEVYFASSQPEHAAEVQAGIRICEKLGVPFAVPVCQYRLTRAKPAKESALRDGYAHFLAVRNKPLQRWMKRVFDICASGIALVLLSPLLVAVAIATKLSSRGPIFFSQERVGLHGRAFKMLKFRSMVVDAEAQKAKLAALNEQTGPVFKMAHDPRVTRLGRLIRKFSIDELPQLVNVLRGDMSVVGPRPPIPTEVARYAAWQRRRLSVRPGLTCVWQVSGRNTISFQDWMLLDMRYIDHWSLFSDFHLILRTFPVVLTGRGAS